MTILPVGKDWTSVAPSAELGEPGATFATCWQRYEKKLFTALPIQTTTPIHPSFRLTVSGKSSVGLVIFLPQILLIGLFPHLTPVALQHVMVSLECNTITASLACFRRLKH